MENKELYNYVLRLGDTSLVFAQRLAEWCSNGPMLEEDMALSNISLDAFGQARVMLTYAGEIEGKGRTEDEFAFHRSEREFFNLLIAERPNGHFGDTTVRNFILSSYLFFLYDELQSSTDERIAAHATKSLKEVTYHVRHSSEWVVRLGDGTDESKEKVQGSIDLLWNYVGDLFDADEVDIKMQASGVGADLRVVERRWIEAVDKVLDRAGLTKPTIEFMQKGSRMGRHSEHLGHMLCEMQFLQRSHPGLEW